MLNLADEAVARLFNMGFSTEDSTKALQTTNYDFDKALEYLIKHPSQSKPKQVQRKKPSHAPPKPPNGRHNKYKNGNKNGNNNKQHRRVESLLDMGFDEDQALRALKQNNNNVQQAIEYLISNLKSDLMKIRHCEH
eukprot:CAMPEP_0201593892 /NCGR_PEP_ID=MMETSP0190_2-20130828/191378_1 /ASSEMBLY_ACC=CAM_ASM_000263 /TAXON_ID=37353 /ORGANISM="Rosalina sp." /LENGTH=135 /DNA_ID=CAMNT_0048053297 /DNA_START=15 /DNA_END=422 /DNA_ORIENTATION=+